MTLTVDVWQLIGLLLTVLGAFWGMGKMLISQSMAHISEQFEVVTETLRGHTEDGRRLERELLELKAELPRDYVRREDHNRVIAAVHVGIDNLRLSVDRAVMLKEIK
ncbi:MAG: hypothetical protein MUF16_00100 [Burkholderiaceae bacterium]|jgi:hypothetical protein|nr:hypothetical protein [Burkholderiaceae bacterium]